ncbi:hypothetical protein KIW84_011105 [Lathyrus oleraceus]|uniref:DUF659 domain-containing protein n=1 Tax=Pisum sativum TaxID=3888 RepID=A0A9D4YMV5_PEA|nr:hypothetical protein KIW84_011105 [Pisum sativum]
MLEVVGSYGPHLKSPSFHELRVPLLKKELEHTEAGTMFMKSVDSSDYAMTWDKLDELLDTFVEEMGEPNFVQLITYNGSDYVAAAEWWKYYGAETPDLQLLVVKMLSLSCSAFEFANASGLNEHVIYTKRSKLLEIASTSRAQLVVVEDDEDEELEKYFEDL